MSADSLSLIAGTALTLIFSYVPGLNTKFAEKPAEIKRLIMLGLLVVVAAAVYGVSCLGYGEGFGITVVCDQQGAVALAQALVIAIIANQSVYAVSPKPAKVQEAREASFLEGFSE